SGRAPVRGGGRLGGRRNRERYRGARRGAGRGGGVACRGASRGATGRAAAPPPAPIHGRASRGGTTADRSYAAEPTTAARRQTDSIAKTSQAVGGQSPAAVGENSQHHPLPQDPGPGGPVGERTRARLLNHDGTFNVRRNELGPLHPYNAYHTLLALTIPRLIGVLCLGYLVTNTFFAALYWLCGPGALAGAATAPMPRFEDSLFFSVQTLATIGYGRLVPVTRAANILVAFEALIGLLGFAIVSGLLFARFTRPTAKISFSDTAIIAPYEDGWAFMFRLVNLRTHDLADVRAVVSFARWAIGADGQRAREFDLLTLERDSILFMP